MNVNVKFYSSTVDCNFKVSSLTVKDIKIYLLHQEREKNETLLKKLQGLRAGIERLYWGGSPTCRMKQLTLMLPHVLGAGDDIRMCCIVFKSEREIMVDR